MPRKRVVLLGALIAVVSIGITALVLLVLVFPTMRGQSEPAAPGIGDIVGGGQASEVVFDPDETTQVLVALQRLPRGFVIPDNALDNAVGVREWPAAAVPVDAIVIPEGEEPADIVREQVIGLITRTDIEREQPILRTLLTEDLTDLSEVGSDTAAQLPQGLVAVALPIDKLSGVAYAVQPGDHIDLIFSFLVVDVDEEFQTALPNWVYEVEYGQFNEEGARITADVNPEFDALLGRIETIPPGELANIVPAEPQRPRLVTQRGVVDALVLYVGQYPPGGESVGGPPEGTSGSYAREYGVTPTPGGGETRPPYSEEVPPPDVITLGVPPQDAVVIAWAVNAQVDITLAIRSTSDVPNTSTSSVTLQYMFETYNVVVPPRLTYSLEPSLRVPPTPITPPRSSSDEPQTGSND